MNPFRTAFVTPMGVKQQGPLSKENKEIIVTNHPFWQALMYACWHGWSRTADLLRKGIINDLDRRISENDIDAISMKEYPEWKSVFDAQYGSRG